MMMMIMVVMMMMREEEEEEEEKVMRSKLVAMGLSLVMMQRQFIRARQSTSKVDHLASTWINVAFLGYFKETARFLINLSEVFKAGTVEKASYK